MTGEDKVGQGKSREHKRGEERRGEERTGMGGEETREENSTSEWRQLGLRQRRREMAACVSGREEVARPAMLAAAATKNLGLASRASPGFPGTPPPLLLQRNRKILVFRKEEGEINAGKVHRREEIGERSGRVRRTKVHAIVDNLGFGSGGGSVGSGLC